VPARTAALGTAAPSGSTDGPARTPALGTAAPPESAKRDAIEQAARAVFGRLGYARASIDQIAAEAGVSTRTLYNHFGDKLGLYSQVLVGGAAEVAEAFERQLADGIDGSAPERSLRVMADAIVAHRARFPEHFALVSRLNAERDQFPDELIAAWLAAGPHRVRALLRRRLGQLADAAGVALADPGVAARHLVALVTSSNFTEPDGPRPPTEAELADAVRVFARGYGLTGLTGLTAPSTSTPGSPA
jgi:AcrR family transcriptional regulator